MAREIDRLRSEAKALQRNAGKKVSRLKRQKGVTESALVDPRVSLDRINRMNSIQLRSHIGKLERFQSRATQYVGDWRGRPIPLSEWKQYEKLQSEVNQRRQDYLNQIRDIPTPGKTTTLGVMADLYGVDSAKHHMPTDAALMPINRVPSQMWSRDALRKLTKNLASELSDKTRKRKLKRWRDEASRMAESIGDPKVLEQLNRLPDNAFELLWVGTAGNFVRSLGHIYNMIQNQLIKNIDYIDSMMDDRINEVNEYLEWVQSPQVSRAINR